MTNEQTLANGDYVEVPEEPEPDPAPTPKVRRNIWELEAPDTWEPTTQWYAKAVAEMQSRPITDPTSWTYLAAVHGTTAPVPPGATWNECQHGSWFFLPWHRMYLYYFEKIVRAAVISLGGPDDWTLPFWDYDTSGQSSLPPAFRARTMPNGSANPLFVRQRIAVWNQGSPLPGSVTNHTAAFADTTYTPPPSPGFGGGITPPQHFFGAFGDLEFTPHNDVHSTIGGFMGDPDFAALDPIFWLHHSNIDRLWNEWIAQGGGRANPADPQWLGQSFDFHDEAGSLVSLTVDQVLDTVTQLDYMYQGATPPPGPAVGVQAVIPEGGDAEMVGASESPVVLSGSPQDAEVVIDRQAVGDHLAAPADAGPTRVYLNVEDVEAAKNPATVYQVFVNLPTGPGAAAAEPAHFVGNVSFFGIEHLSGAGGHGGHGFRRTFDITDRVAELRQLGLWDPDRLTVSFRPIEIPVGEEVDVSAADAQEMDEQRSAPVSIGRVSLFFQ